MGCGCFTRCKSHQVFFPPGVLPTRCASHQVPFPPGALPTRCPSHQVCFSPGVLWTIWADQEVCWPLSAWEDLPGSVVPLQVLHPGPLTSVYAWPLIARP